MRQFTRISIVISLITLGWCLLVHRVGMTATSKVEDIIAKVWDNSQAQGLKVNDYLCTILTNKQEKDSTGKIESVTEIEMKSYYKKPGKQLKQFVKATKDGKSVSKKDLQPGMFAAPFLKPAEELAEEIQKEMVSIITFSPDYLDKFDIKLLREEKIEGNNTWVIEVTSRSKNLKLERAMVWVSQDRSRTLKIEADSIKNPSFFVKMIKITTYLGEVAAGIFLPTTTRIETSLSKVSSKKMETINEYSLYQINTGLEDNLFQKKQKE